LTAYTLFYSTRLLPCAGFVGNPDEGERNSGMIPNSVPV